MRFRRRLGSPCASIVTASWTSEVVLRHRQAWVRLLVVERSSPGRPLSWRASPFYDEMRSIRRASYCRARDDLRLGSADMAARAQRVDRHSDALGPPPPRTFATGEYLTPALKRLRAKQVGAPRGASSRCARLTRNVPRARSPRSRSVRRTSRAFSRRGPPRRSDPDEPPRPLGRCRRASAV